MTVHFTDAIAEPDEPITHDVIVRYVWGRPGRPDHYGILVSYDDRHAVVQWDGHANTETVSLSKIEHLS